MFYVELDVVLNALPKFLDCLYFASKILCHFGLLRISGWCFPVHQTRVKEPLVTPAFGCSGVLQPHSVTAAPRFHEDLEGHTGLWHLSFLPLTSHCPTNSPEPPGRDRPCSARPGLRAGPFCFLQPAQGFLSTAVPCSEPLAPCNPGRAQGSALTSPWGGFGSPCPQWGPLTLQGTWSLASDSLSSFFILLSVPEGPGLSPKSSMGLIKIQKALRSSFSSFSCLQVSRACAADWSQFGVLLSR